MCWWRQELLWARLSSPGRRVRRAWSTRSYEVRQELDKSSSTPLSCLCSRAEGQQRGSRGAAPGTALKAGAGSLGWSGCHPDTTTAPRRSSSSPAGRHRWNSQDGVSVEEVGLVTATRDRLFKKASQEGADSGRGSVSCSQRAPHGTRTSELWELLAKTH